MFCKECGTQYDKANFCPNCGTPINEHFVSQPQQPYHAPNQTPFNNTINKSPNASSPVLCPIEGNNDSIQSLPALIASGNARGLFSGPSGGVTYSKGNIGYYGGTTTLNGTFTTNIAAALAKPNPPETLGAASLYGWCWAFYLSMCTIIGPYFVFKALTERLVKNPDFRKKIFTFGFNLAFMFSCFFGVTLVFFPITLMFRKMLEKKLEYPRRFKQWEESCVKWEKLYYCHRCGLVFNPENNDHFTPDQLHSYISIDKYE